MLHHDRAARDRGRRNSSGRRLSASKAAEAQMLRATAASPFEPLFPNLQNTHHDAMVGMGRLDRGDLHGGTRARFIDGPQPVARPLRSAATGPASALICQERQISPPATSGLCLASWLAAGGELSVNSSVGSWCVGDHRAPPVVA
jgi:hypothetical protein